SAPARSALRPRDNSRCKRLHHEPGPPTTLIPVLQSLAQFFYCNGHHQDLHSVPTRRSSDLAASPTRPSNSRASSRRCRITSARRSEEHTSELQSPYDLVCRLLLEKKNAGEAGDCFITGAVNA